MAASDPIALAQKLIRCPSITPVDAGALDVLGDALAGLGFAVKRQRFGEGTDTPTDNLYARIGGDGPVFMFAGHTDVVPPGKLEQWSVDPFAGVVDQGMLIGRGANDMKSAIAAFVTAAGRHLRSAERRGSIALLITGDEEGAALHGTNPMLDWMESQGERADHCLVGEPTSKQVFGDMMKIGRRGSINIWIDVNGAQGHVAYPHRADNPLTRLVAILSELKARTLDEGTDFFDPSNLEVTTIDVGNPTENVIPARASARLNIRYNDRHSGTGLQRWVEDVTARHAPGANVRVRISGEPFLTEPGRLTSVVSGAVEAVTGRAPEQSTSGGTSDARFIRRMCPVVEFGLVGATMHKVDELAPVADILKLADVYERILNDYFLAV